MSSQVTTTLSVYILFALFCHGSSLSLYSADDPVHELDTSNFQSVIFKKSNAWIIEFYSNWCGHCIRFAPTWKRFARDIRTWRSVDVGVLNCADPKNLMLCREYDINAYPSIKVFKSFVNETDKGDSFAPDTNIEAMASSLTKFLESYQDQNAPADWPDLHPLELSSVRGITNLLKNNEGSLIIFIEHADSFNGKKVIMDLSFQTSVAIRRVLMTNEDLLNDLNIEVENSTLATVVKIDKSGNTELLFKFPADTNSTYIRDQIFLHVVGSPRNEIENVLGSKTNTSIKVSVRDSVHMVDLENALRYLLYQEIGVTKNIYGDRLHALKSFLLTLKHYFPGKPPIMEYLSKLNDWVTSKNNITGEEFVHKLDELKTSDEYLPEMQDFVSCKGSEPRYRGYPCSLWTLFHTLTVQAYIKDAETAGGMHLDVMTVLPNIKGYIRNFFTCEECVQNFFKMDQNIERDASTSSNAVLWLWAAHNRVNQRLSGDITEDPHHPKIQFPSPNMCPSCRLENENSDEIKWDEVQVLRFLKHFYSKQNIVASINEGYHSSYSSGNSPTALKFILYLVVNLLMGTYQYTIQKMDSY